MRVAILNLTRGGLSGGYRTYLRNLIPRLAGHPAISALAMVSPPAYRTRHEGVEVRHFGASEPYLGFRPTRRFVRRWQPDVVFVPTARWIACDAPTVVMVRNMEPMLPMFAEDVRDRMRLRLAGIVARHAARRADRVIAVSGFVREQLMANWGVDGRHVGVVPHGVSAIADDVGAPAALGAVASGPFLLAAGSLRPYRGLEDGIRALAELEARFGERVPFVVAGGGSRRYAARMRALARRERVDDRVHWVGELTPPEVAWAMRHCAALVMSSRIEACPNTVLEAMAYGVVSVAVSSAPMPEFYGDTALYYDAGNASQLAERLREALALNVDQRQALSARALGRAALFTWDATAERTVAELERAVRGTTRAGRRTD